LTQYRMTEIKDINRVVKLEVECMTELHNKIGGEFPVFDERHNNEANLISIIEGGCGCAFLAEEYDTYGKGYLIGAVIAIDEEMKTADEEEHNKLVIYSIFVEQNYRKQGVAHKLLEMIN
jgi:GNAT superfamily N-acetyltransferase